MDCGKETEVDQENLDGVVRLNAQGAEFESKFRVKTPNQEKLLGKGQGSHMI